MLRSARFVDLKGLRDLSVDLGRLTLLVGPNGVGKTTILEGLFLAGLVARKPKRNPFKQGRWKAANLIHAGSKRFSINLHVEEHRFEITANTKFAPEKLAWQDGQAEEMAIFWRAMPPPREPPTLLEGHWRPLLAGLDENQNPYDPYKALLEEASEKSFFQQPWLGSFSRAFRLELSREAIAEPVKVAETPPGIDSDGGQLPVFLQYLHGLRNGTLERIEEKVRDVVPKFLRVQFRPTTVEVPGVEEDGKFIRRSAPGVELLLEFEGGAVVPAVHASEGTLLVLTLLTVAYAPQQHHLILIDDLDRALHPAAQHRVMVALKKALEVAPHLQIVATTHSPDLVDACEPGEVRVMGFDEQGDPALARLSDHPDAPKWLKLMRTGEFWNSVGEEWVHRVPHRPASAPPKPAEDASEHG